MERFLHRRWDGRILDVDEFQVAKCLLAGETELLSQEVDSGEHLFDLCCRFGHESTAAAMISYRVPGCVFKGPHSLQPPPAVEPPEPPADFHRFFPWCRCMNRNTCRHCSWGVSDEERGLRGLWMEDSDASLQDAKSAAESSAAKPLVRALLEAFRSQAAVDGIATAAAVAYLLDVAILIGDAELARRCAKHCTRLPLRRWRGHELVRIMEHILLPCLLAEIREKDVLIAALAAGLELEHLKVEGRMSLAEAIVLSADAELWRRVEGLQLKLGLWPAQYRKDNEMARFLLEHSGGQVRLSSERLHRAQRAGLALSSFQVWVPCDCQACGYDNIYQGFSLLDLAILFGQSDCARLCGPMDVVARKVTLKASLEAMPLVWKDERECNECACTSFRIPDYWDESIASLPERRAAAAEALRAALRASRRKTAGSAGFGLFQAMRSWARGKLVPVALVNLVLTFAAERPSLLQALEGREAELPPLGHWWEESEHRLHQDPRGPQPKAESTEPHPVSESVGMREESGQDGASQNPQQADDPCVQAGPSSFANGGDPSVAAASSPTNADTPSPDVKRSANDDLMIALRDSKSDMPPLSPEGAVVFRLSRQSNAPRVNDILFDATGPLAELHLRVLEAGCEVRVPCHDYKPYIGPIFPVQSFWVCHTFDICIGRFFIGDFRLWFAARFSFVGSPIRAGRTEMVAGEGLVYSRDGAADAGVSSLGEPLSSESSGIAKRFRNCLKPDAGSPRVEITRSLANSCCSLACVM